MNNLIGFLVLFAMSSPALAQLTAVSKQELVSPSFISNPGFENGKVFWTASGGTFTTTTTAANVAYGSTAASWDSSAAQALTSDQYSIPASLYGARCQMAFHFKGGDANIVAEVIDGSIAAQATQTLATASTYRRVAVSFACPTSGTLAFRLRSTADAAVIYLDQVFVGAELQVGNLVLDDTDSIYNLKVQSTSTLSIDRLLTIDIDDGSRTFEMGGSLAFGAAFSTGPSAVTLTTSGGAASVTLPNTGTLATLAGSETLTNKSMSGAANTFTAIPLTTAVTGILPTANGGTAQNSTATFPTSGVVVTEAASETLSSKTLASPLVTTLASFQAQAETRWADADSSNYVSFKGPATVSSNITWTLPSADGTSGQVLSTNGSGTLSWAASGGGGLSGLTTTQIPYATSTTAITTPAASGTDTFTWDSTNKRVGIGTTAPAEQLQITGNFRIPSTTSTVGQIKMGTNPYIHSFASPTTNFFAGANAGNLTLSGTNIVAVGATAGSSLTSGIQNSFLGYAAAANMDAGNDNIAIGYSADNSTSGNNNVAIGSTAFASRGVGSNNTGVGYAVGFTLSTGSSNTLIGKSADVGSGALTNATAIGANAVVSASNSLVLGSSVNVGIGTASPATKLEVVGASDIIQAQIRAHSTQTSNIFNVEKSDGTDYFTVKPLGAVSISETGGNGGNVPHARTRRSSTSNSSATCAVTCSAGETAVGGGCQNSLALNMADSYPSADATWTCEYTLATGNCTAWAVCFQY